MYPHKKRSQGVRSGERLIIVSSVKSLYHENCLLLCVLWHFERMLNISKHMYIVLAIVNKLTHLRLRTVFMDMIVILGTFTLSSENL